MSNSSKLHKVIKSKENSLCIQSPTVQLYRTLIYLHIYLHRANQAKEKEKKKHFK